MTTTQETGMTTKIETVTLTEETHTDLQILYPAAYRVEMPADYDPQAVTGEDILLDGALTIVGQEDIEHDCVSDEYECVKNGCQSVTTADGHGAYCRWCGETLA